MPKYKKVRRLELDRLSLPRVSAWSVQKTEDLGGHSHDEYLRRDGTTTLTGSWDAGDAHFPRFHRMLVGGAPPFPISASLGISVQSWLATRLFDPDLNRCVGAYIQGPGTTVSPEAGSAIAFWALVTASAQNTSSPFSHRTGVGFLMSTASAASSASLQTLIAFYGQTQDVPSQRYLIYGEANSGSSYMPESASIAGFELSDSGWKHFPEAASRPGTPASGGYFWAENGSPLWVGPDGEIHNLAASGLSTCDLDNIYVRRDGTTPMTASWDAGPYGFKITGSGIAIGQTAVLGGENWVDVRGTKAAASARGAYIEIEGTSNDSVIRGIEIVPIFGGTTSASEAVGVLVHNPTVRTIGASIERKYGFKARGFAGGYSFYGDYGLAYFGEDLRVGRRAGFGTNACPTDISGVQNAFRFRYIEYGTNVEVFRIEGGTSSSESAILTRLILVGPNNIVDGATILDLGASANANPNFNTLYALNIRDIPEATNYYAIYAAGGSVYVAESGSVGERWEAQRGRHVQEHFSGWENASAFWTWRVHNNGTIGLGTSSSVIGNGILVFGMRNAIASPTAALSNGGIFWAGGGKPYWMDSAGNVYDLTQGAGAGTFRNLDVSGGGTYTQNASLAASGNLYLTESGSVIRIHDSASPTYNTVTTNDLSVNNRVISDLRPWQPGDYSLGHSTSPWYAVYAKRFEVWTGYLSVRLREDAVLDLDEAWATSPSTAASKSAFYVGSDKLLYQRTSSGSTIRISRPRVKRSFGWYVSGTAQVGTSLGPIYRMDAKSTVLWVVLNAKTAPNSGSFAVDVQRSSDYSTWSSILSSCAAISNGANTGSSNAFAVTDLAYGDWIRLDIASAEGAQDVTVQLWIETEAEQ